MEIELCLSCYRLGGSLPTFRILEGYIPQGSYQDYNILYRIVI